MKSFAALLERLIFTPGRNAKLAHLQAYFRATSDPDRGWALAALTGSLNIAAIKPAAIRALAESRSDAVLFGWSLDFVGDLAETVALIWPRHRAATAAPPSLSEVVERARLAARSEAPMLLADWLDRLDATSRWALIKLFTGELRVGVSQRLVKMALAAFGDVAIDEVEEVWPGVAPPYAGLFGWLERGAARPAVDHLASFRPLMLAQALEEADAARLKPEDFCAEWKWDGIRVQLLGGMGQTRIISRGGDEIGASFPELAELAGLRAVLDGELLIRLGEVHGSFNELQQRLNRKTVSAAQIKARPAFVRLYDILFDDDEDLRGQPFVQRRERLEEWYRRRVLGTPMIERFDLSALLRFDSWQELAKARALAESVGAEGLMLKRRDGPYVAGRPKGLWFKWKRAPDTVDAVLLYAQRGHGKRSSYYSDFTFGCWREEADGRAELVPVGKAYFGFTDEELRELDRWVRSHTIERFGPVRRLEPALVLEIAYEGLRRSPRHKSGIALRFPRIARIRWDKPAAEADRLEALLSRIRD
ncbi:MAG TPA: cisplatin damage response ATP-dependent DNA ligase [Ferrovibrio sp.]|uniref:cisplatin damage response ATP-dependent DNA ligase n=1 Tax=Ferrovibrio sp. TaxID=1917215 RepID=UPI002ED0CBBC